MQSDFSEGKSRKPHFSALSFAAIKLSTKYKVIAIAKQKRGGKYRYLVFCKRV